MNFQGVQPQAQQRAIVDALSFLDNLPDINSNDLQVLRHRFDLLAEVGAWNSASQTLRQMELHGLEPEEVELLDLWLMSRLPSLLDDAISASSRWLANHDEHPAYASIINLNEQLIEQKSSYENSQSRAQLAPLLGGLTALVVCWILLLRFVRHDS